MIEKKLVKEIEHLGLSLAAILTNLEILKGALDDDSVPLEEKVNVAKMFTNQILSRYNIKEE